MKLQLTPILAAICLVLFTVAWGQSPSTVLVVGNANNASSVTLVNYYMNARNIPAQNQLLLNLPAQYTPDNVYQTTLADFENLIAPAIYAYIATLPHIDYIVMCRNLPYIISDTSSVNGYSIDSLLAGITLSKISNPYYGAHSAFNSLTYGMFLVNRLDGYSWSDATSLVNNSLTAMPAGPFFFDEANIPFDTNPTYAPIDEYMTAAAVMLESMKVPTILSQYQSFYAPPIPLGGYRSWGNLDQTYTKPAFAALQFAPGSICELTDSNSGRRIRAYDRNETFAQMAQLIHQGLTAGQAYASEPLVNGHINDTLLFPNYLAGMNAAESFYSSSEFLGWKSVDLGDPLCSPYSFDPFIMP